MDKMFWVPTMKKSHIILAAVPVVCALGGFGGGMLLKGTVTAAPAQHAVEPRTEAEGILHSLAGDTDSHAAPDTHAAPAHDDSHSTNTHATPSHDAVVMPAAYTGTDDHATDQGAAPAPVVIEAHRLDADKLAKHAHEVMLEKTKEERRKALAAKMAEIETRVQENSSHPALLPVDVEARISEDAIKRVAASEDHVVKLGRITLPVESAAKTTYYVADFGVAVTDMDQASYYYSGENAARLRDQVMLTLHRLGPTQMMRSELVNSDQLAERVAVDLREKFTGIESFLFLSLYKTDVPRT